jgi:flagellin-like hook-associated protein FlgL
MKRPSEEIKQIFKNTKYGLQNLFSGMNSSNLDSLIASDDKEVKLAAKRNISIIDYITYLVSCMIPASYSTPQHTSSDIYILTIHDDTTYDDTSNPELNITGPYFKVERVSYKTNKSDAFQIDIGFGNTGTIVTDFRVMDDESPALLYEYNEKLETSKYVQRIDNQGQIQNV